MSRTSATSRSKLVLKEHQIEHVENLQKILQIYRFGIDGSKMGLGKTITTSIVLEKVQLKGIIVIAPAAIIPKWQEMKTIYGINIIMAISYDSLRGKTGSTLKHGLLERDDEGTKTVFTTTALCDEYIEEGVLFVFDEGQKLKNTSAQFHAANTICKAVFETENKSKVLVLTGTLNDKEEQCINTLRMMNIITHRELARKERDSSHVALLGIAELILFCNTLDEIKTLELCRTIGYAQHNLIHLCYKLFIDVVCHFQMAQMSSPKEELGIDLII